MFLVLCARYHDQLGDTDAGFYDRTGCDQRPLSPDAAEAEADMWFTGTSAKGEDNSWVVWSELLTSGL